jgi:hypothetical protein
MTIHSKASGRDTGLSGLAKQTVFVEEVNRHDY